jgi:hypothetical protein
MLQLQIQVAVAVALEANPDLHLTFLAVMDLLVL